MMRIFPKKAVFIPVVVSISILFMTFFPVCTVRGEEQEMRPSQLYARYAVLMDADTGRILFAKSGSEEAPMASTTKIMTCILALENSQLNGEVSVSENAESQPEVKLGMKSGQKFYLKDLLYSLMLESHNDSAVAIAEYVGGDVETFADMMNEKAEELNCTSTYFITPNGLDAKDENGMHHTTAADLANIMRYCIMDSPQRELFLDITRTEKYTFSDLGGNSSYSCTNHNAFLKMMDGALSGKTGFTADAGYCYVGALRDDGRTFIVALLACGWPNNKGYKWSDTKKLMEYGIENYTYREITPDIDRKYITVRNGYTGGFPTGSGAEIPIYIQGDPLKVLAGSGDEVECRLELPDHLNAPVAEDDKIGQAVYTLDGIRIAVYPVCAGESVSERTLKACFDYVSSLYLK